MADLDDLGYTSILNMENDEAIELLRQVRLSRRIPLKKKTVAKRKQKSIPSVDTTTAAELLRILGANNE